MILIMHKPLFFFLVLACLSHSQPTRAAGLAFPGIGTSAMARGGAFIASGDDLTSIFYNPANLSRHKGFHILHSSAFLFTRYQYQRTQHPSASSPFPGVNNVAPFQYTPFIGISYDWGVLQLPQSHRIVLAAAAWQPASGSLWWDEHNGTSAQPDCVSSSGNQGTFLCDFQGPQRYASLRNQSDQWYLALGLSYVLRLPTVKLRLGGGFYLVQTQINRSFVAKIADTSSHTNTGDATIQINAATPYTPNGIAGLSIDLPHGVGLGISFRTNLKVQANGTLSTDSQNLQALMEGDRIQVQYSIPWSFRFGLSWTPTFFKRLSIEASFVYEPWSQHEQVTLLSPQGDRQITLKPGNQPLQPITLPLQYQDAWSVHTGAQIQIVPRTFALQLGWFYESGAIPNAVLSVSNMHYERHALSIGFKTRIFVKSTTVTLGAAYTHTLQPQHNVANTSLTPIFLNQSGPPTHNDPIANGTYNISSSLIQFTVGRAFGGE
jgi:long-subunit fatty acid transport protein